MPPSSSRAAFVTGGSGFVGLNIVKELMIRGWDVTALHRPSSDLQLLKRFRPKLAVGALTDQAAMLAAIPEGTDTIFHVAGNTNMWRGGNAEQTRDNVDGTRHVVNAALAKRVRRLVVTSSISAYGMVSGEINEETPSLAAKSRVNYQKSKWQAQEIALAATLKGLEVVIMQPGAIMGPYDVGTWSRLFLMVNMPFSPQLELRAPAAPARQAEHGLQAGRSMPERRSAKRKISSLSIAARGSV
jgi:nucleoside-diphosphate-sugar epimerase